MTRLALYFLVCCLISAAAAIANWFSYKILMAEAIFSSLWSGLGINTKLWSAVFFLSLLILLLIFPVAAYFLKSEIYLLPISDTTRSLIYICFSIFPLLCLIPVLLSLLIKRFKFGRFQSRLLKMIEADPEIEVLDYQFKNQSSARGILELEVRISNLLPAVSRVVFQTRFLEDVHFRIPVDGKGDSGWIEAVSENGMWVFISDCITKKKLSDSEASVRYQVRFSRSYDEQPYLLPKRIRLILGAHDPVYHNIERIYYRDFNLDCDDTTR